jgi:hypothetical protein
LGRHLGIMQQIVAAGATCRSPPDTSEDAAQAWWMSKPGGRVLVLSTMVQSWEPPSFIRISQLLAVMSPTQASGVADRSR